MEVNLRGGWNDLIGAIQIPAGLWVLLTALGVLVVVFAFAKMLWDKRRGGGGGFSSILIPLAIGALLAAPRVIVPLLLWAADLGINTVVSLVKRGTGS